MCLVLYVGSETRLHGEQEGIELFRVAGQRPVRRRLARPELYEIRTLEGCGCGFIDEEVPPDPEVQVNRAALRSLLGQLLPQAGGALDLFACWISDERLPATERVITPAQLPEESFGETAGRPLLLRIREAGHAG